VIGGAAHLLELQQRQEAFLRALRAESPRNAAGETREILGFRMSAAWASDLAAIDLARLSRCLSGRNLLLLEAGQPPLGAEERIALAQRCAHFTHRCDMATEPWLERPHQIYLPGKAIGEIATWMASLY
jgi:hypothetical protein